MIHTFDIRFARSAGLAAFLEAPENRFHWKGGGLLRIDAQSISFTVKRSLLALFARHRVQHIPAEDLREVYREGDALRVEFQTKEILRTVLPFWAGDPETAAQIVRLLPTTHTVEMEHSTAATRSGKSRADWLAMTWIGLALAAVVAGSWALYPRAPAPLTAKPAQSGEAAVSAPGASAPSAVDSPAVEATSPPTVAQASPESAAATPDASGSEGQTVPSLILEPPQVVLPPPPPLPLPRDSVRSEEFVIPIARGAPAYAVALRELAAFESDAVRLESDYRNSHKLLTSRGLSVENFAARLDEYEMRWWDVTFRIFDNDDLAQPALLDLRAAMLGAARQWRNFLSGYAAGLRQRDHVMMARAFDALARAQELQSRARLFLR